MLPDKYRGVNLHPMWFWSATTDVTANICQILSESNVESVRIDFPFNWMSAGLGQPFIPAYFSRFQRFVQLCPADIEILVIACYTPKWANGGGGENIPWTNVSDWTSSVQQLVEAFPERVAGWEIWNEPDLDYAWSWTTGTAQQRSARYVELLEAAYPVIKAINPAAKVVAPAVSGTPSTPPWLAGFYEADPQGHYDVVSAHMYGDPPYHGSLAPHDTVQGFTGTVWPLIASNGDSDRPLWITETGWNTCANPAGVSLAQQAANVTAIYDEIDAQLPAAERVHWYELSDGAAAGASSDANNYYGLLDAMNTPKAAWAAFNALP